MDTNFEDKEFQIKVNNERLQEEYLRYNEIRSRIGFTAIFYSIYAAYSIQLIKYGIDSKHFDEWYFYVLLAIFLFCFVYSLINTIRLLLPKEVAYKDLPKVYYKEIKEEYKNKGIQIDHIKYYLRETYLGQIEKSVSTNFKLNNKKSYFHYLAFKYALIALLPYIICVGIIITNEPDDIVKVEIVSNLKSSSMCEKENDNQSTSSEEPVVDANQVIQRDPVLIKENKSEPTTKESTESNEGGEK